MSTTANIKRSRFAVALTLAVTAAACGTVAPAYADPDCTRIPGLCDLVSTTPTPAPSTCTETGPLAEAVCAGRELEKTWPDEGGGVGDWISDHILWIVIGAAVVIAIAVMNSKTKGREASQARGRQIAEAHQQRVQPAAPVPDPTDFDPLGLGLAAPKVPAALNPAPIPEPRLTDEDARRYARYGYAVDYATGSAFASLTTRDGDWKQAEAAWTAACQAAAIGETQMRKSRIPGIDSHRAVYVAPADLVRVIPLENGDATVVVKPRSVAIGADELNRAVPMFLRTARLRHAGRFVREHTTDEYLLRVSNRDLATESASATATAATTDDDDWS